MIKQRNKEVNVIFQETKHVELHNIPKLSKLSNILQVKGKSYKRINETCLYRNLIKKRKFLLHNRLFCFYFIQIVNFKNI